MAHRRLRFAGRRLLVLVPQMIAVSAATFFLIRLLPGNPAIFLLGPRVSPSGIAALEERMGLNEPIVVQYWLYVGNALHGDLGRSWFTGSEVLKDLATRTPATLELLAYSMIVGMIVGIALGAFSAVRKGNGPGKRVINLYLGLAGSFPDFWIALLLTYVFYFRLRLVPAPLGRLDPGSIPPPTVTGFYTVDSLLAGDLRVFVDAVLHLALPVFVLGVIIIGPGLGKIAHAAMSDVLRADFIRYSRAMGATKHHLARYVLRNSLAPILTMAATYLVYCLGGVVLIEKVFSWGGVGEYAVQAVINSDYAAIQGFALVAAAFTLLVYLVVDVVHSFVDPRVSL
jgi:ABC-type dipeptide/oligopeptide/nickel transport system permease component